MLEVDDGGGNRGQCTASDTTRTGEQEASGDFTPKRQKVRKREEIVQPEPGD